MKKLQLMVDISESSANIADIESGTGFKFPESTGLPLLKVVEMHEKFIDHWSDTFAPIKPRFEV